jgi:quercetin dioxygenase-like cupin family protein
MDKIQSKPFFLSNQEPTYQVEKGITRQFIAYDNNIMMVKVDFDKGSIGYQHTHPHTQTSYVISGKFEVTIGNEIKTLAEGDGFYVEPDIIHGCVCLESGSLIDTFSPIREDFYKTLEKE